MKSKAALFLAPFVFSICFIVSIPNLHAAATQKDNAWDLAVLEQLMASVQPGQTLVQAGDMMIPVSYLQWWTNYLAGGPQPNLAVNTGFTAWPGGNVYYTFSNNVAPVKQKAFTDGMAEWATFANLHFIPYTNKANYVLIYEATGAEGGVSMVGMVGGQQTISIGPNSWNRPTICHELGHTLGLVHEHQRSDRNSYVNIIAGNIAPGQTGNFVLLSNSTNETPYDFLSIMHYSRNELSANPQLDVIDPLPAYTNYVNIMGQLSDPVLSSNDRAGMTILYGKGPTITNIVTNTLDAGPGSLRAALYYAFDHPGTTISFNIPVTDPGYSNNVFNILLSYAEPGLWYNTTLDGSTQTNHNPNGPAILLNGIEAFSLSTFPNGLRFRGTNNIARAFVINSFPENGILFDGTNCIGNTVGGCYVGLDPTGTIAVINAIYPVAISGGAVSNIIGGTTAAMHNVIGGGFGQGIIIRDTGTRSNTVEGNYIGVTPSGAAAIGNTTCGINLLSNATWNVIGGTVSGAGNVIGGNGSQGVLLQTNCNHNYIQGNFIGVNAAGTAAIPNGTGGVRFAGIEITTGSQSNLIGGLTAGARNIISGNTLQGVLIDGNTTTGNVVEGNYLGLNAAGTGAISNGLEGVNIATGASGNYVGGMTAAARNMISGNTEQGVLLSDPGTSGNYVIGNYIGVNLAGTAAISNGWEGVDIANGATGNFIGGTAAGAGNVISGNGFQGVQVQDAGASGNYVQGNYIGVNAAGTAAITNGLAGFGFAGVELSGGAAGNFIGGATPGAGNVISGNYRQGVAIDGSGTSGNLIQGNFIGLNAAGTAAIPNGYSGVEMFSSASGNLVGGYGGARNFLSGNADYGVYSDFNNGNTIQGNTIGLNVLNDAAVPNGFSGVGLGSTSSNIIGGVFPGAANIIAGNSGYGVQAFTVGTNNTIRGNSIYNNTFGTALSLSSPVNNSIAAPTLTSAVVTTNTIISGSYTGASSVHYLIDFYSDAPPAFSAEAQTYLGAITVTGTGASSAFTATLGVHLPSGRSVTATVTDPAGNTSQLCSGVAATMTSSVNDGIPDAWRKLYFGGTGTTTNSQSDAFADADHTGLDNYQKFLAGLNPTNPASVFKLTALNPRLSTNAISLSTSNGIVYRVWSRNDLLNGYWGILADQVIGNGTNMLFYDPAEAVSSREFYRAEILW